MHVKSERLHFDPICSMLIIRACFASVSRIIALNMLIAAKGSVMRRNSIPYTTHASGTMLNVLLSGGQSSVPHVASAKHNLQGEEEDNSPACFSRNAGAPSPWWPGQQLLASLQTIGFCPTLYLATSKSYA